MSGVIRTGFSVCLAIAAWSGCTNGPELHSTNGVFHIGANEINSKTLMLKRGKTTEELTARELRILQLMHAHLGEVFSRDRLLSEVWGYNYFGTTRTLDRKRHAKRLCSKAL